MRIIPSIASAGMLNIESTLKKLGEAGTLHIDIEDGNFIPNITFGMKTVKEISKATKLSLNAHLMVTNPLAYIRPLAECGVKEAAFHLESSPYPLEVIREIKKYGMKAGLAFNFSTPVFHGEPFIEDLDFLLIMTSEPDGGNQSFRKSSLKRIYQARQLAGTEKSVWVDGGIGENELFMVCQAGADTAVMGRAVVQAKQPKERLSYFHMMMSNKQEED